MTARLDTLQKMAKEIGMSIKREHFKGHKDPTYIIYRGMEEVGIAKSLVELDNKISWYWRYQKTGIKYDI